MNYIIFILFILKYKISYYLKIFDSNYVLKFIFLLIKESNKYSTVYLLFKYIIYIYILNKNNYCI